ncbi:MAG: TIM barrel protein [Mesorhizobium sp.]
MPAGLSINHYLCPPDYGAERFMVEVAAAGGTGVGLTLVALDELGAAGCRAIASRDGLSITTLNSAGNFLLRDKAAMDSEHDKNKRLVAAAAEMGASALVVVTGGLSGQVFVDDMLLRTRPIWSVADAASRVEEELAPLLDEARTAGVRLALEPIHPMDILFKGVITSLAASAPLCARFPGLELVLDIYHSWWDPDLLTATVPVAGLQLCGLVQHNRDCKPDRDVLGEGIVDLAPVISSVRNANPKAFFEFEMFDRHRRGRDVEGLIRQAVSAWKAVAGVGEGAR